MFPGNVDNIGYGVFADCVSLLTVKANGNVGNISKEAFAGCISLKSIEVNGNIENISEFAFSDDGIDVQSPYCTILESVKINGYIGNIGKSAFFRCSSLKNIGALGGIRNIEDKAFAYCASLVNIECNADMENIGESAFCGCSSLKTVTIKGGVEFISDYAFSDSSTYNPSYCISLENVKIDGDIGTLGSRAFFNCSKLNNIEVGGNITNICDETFSDCNSLINITIHGNINSLNSSMFIGCNLLKNVEIAGNVEKICKSTFSENCSNLEKVIIGGNVGTIETYAFYKCGNLLSIEINGDVGNIGESAFSQCNLLKNVEIDGDVGDIESYAFSTLWSGCSGLENVKIGGSVNSFGDSVFFKSSLKIIEIGGSVGVIGDNAFRECVDLEAFKVGEDINSIGKMAFNGCTSLKSVDVYGNVGGIGNSAFEDCDALTDVAFGGNVGDIEKEAFYGCDALNSIIFSGNVGNIKEKAFYACESLESIKIQGDVESIGTSAFSKCISLTDMVILGSVGSIGNRAFSECSKIREFVIPANVTSIESGTFENCASLSSVTLPSSLISIGENAFYKCSSLRDIYYGGTKKEWENIDKAASRLPSNVTVHYNSNGEEAILSNYYVGTVEDAWYGGEDNSETWVKIDGIDYQVWNQISVVIYPDFIKGKQIAYILDEQNRVTKYVLVSDAKIGRVKNYNPENNTLEIENETGGCYLQDGITNANVLEKAGLLPGKLIRYTTVSVGKSVDGLIAFGLVDAELVETFAGKITTLDVLSDPWQVYLEGYDRTFPVNMAQPGLQDQLISLQNVETVITLLDGRICYVYGVEELFKVECSPSGNFSEEGPVGTILWKDDRYLDEPLNFDVSIGCSIADIIGDQKVVEQYMAGRSLYLDKIKLHTDLDILEPSEQIIKVNQFLYINQTNQISVEFKIKKGLHDAPKEESSWETIGIDFLGNDWNKAGFGRVSIVNEDLIAENEKKRQEAEEAFQEEADIAAKIAGEAFKRFKQNAEMQARECITLPGELASYLNEEEAQALRVGIAARIILAKMQSNGFIAKLAEMGIDKIVSEKVFDLLMKWSYGDWQFDVSAKKIQIPVAARIETAKHGTIYVEMTCDIQNFDLKDSTFGTWGTIYVDKLTVEKNKNPISVPGNGIISIADMSGFADGVEDVALAQAGKAVNEIRKDNLNKMVVTELAKRISSFYFEEAIEDIVQYVVDEHLSESAVRIICTAEKIMGVHCPVDLYLYNVDGELAGSIVNSQVYTEDENLDMWTDGDSKYIRILDGTYNVVYEARGNGEMKVEILERGSADLDWRTVVFDKVPLVTGNLYTSSLDDKLDADYTLVSCNGDVIEPDEVIDNYPDEPSGISGDINGDGKVTAVDARWVLQIAAGTRVL